MEPEELTNMKTCQFRSSMAGMATMVAGGSIAFLLLRSKSLRLDRFVPKNFYFPVMLGTGVGSGYAVTITTMKACREEQLKLQGHAGKADSIVELREYVTQRVRPRSETPPDVKPSVTEKPDGSPPQIIHDANTEVTEGFTTKYGDTGFFKADER